MIAALVLVGALVCAATPALAVQQLNLGGTTPSGTSIEISRSSFPTGCTTVVIAEETVWQDQLLGAGLAGAVRGPLLLSSPAVPSAALNTEIARLGATRAFVLTHSRMSMQLAWALVSSMPDGAEILTVRTEDVPRGARAIARLVAAERLVAPTCALVLNPESWPTAIAAAGPAAAAWPVLFADPARPSANTSTLAELDITDVVVVGGPSAALDGEMTALLPAVGSSHIRRVSGANRYALAQAMTDSVAVSAGLGYSAPVIVSGAGSAGAILAGTLAARRRSVTLFAGPAGVGDHASANLFAHRASVGALAFVGTTSSLPTRLRVEAQQALRALPFSEAKAMAHIKALTGFGSRRAGGSAEHKAADYMAAQLRAYGYKVTIQSVAIPGGKTSRNVIAQKAGSSSDVIVLGAHLDSKYPSPGGNDNASGVAVTLEIARCLANAEGLVPTVRFIGFGAEEISGARSADHHFGSRRYVKSLSSSQLAAVESMVSIDMVGYGSVFNARNLRVGPMTTVKSLQSWGSFTKQPLPFLKDPGRDGWSDHEAFEFRGVPVAWLEWRNDPVYHTTRDTHRHVSANRVRRTGRLVRGWLLDLARTEVAALRP